MEAINQTTIDYDVQNGLGEEICNMDFRTILSSTATPMMRKRAFTDLRTEAGLNTCTTMRWYFML